MCIENNDNYRLYIGSKRLHFATFEEAKREAEQYMPETEELRIEILIETNGPDFWAYEYNNHQWVPS